MKLSKPLSPSKIQPPSSDSIARAVECLLAGELVGLPTETVYGLAARGDVESAVDKIFAAKNRPRTNPLILHVGCAEDAISLFAGDLAPVLRQRIERLGKFWPGPLTLIGPRHHSILDHVTAGGDTVAVRVPDHPVALELLRQLAITAGRPIPVAAPSANPSNYVSPTTADHVADGLGDQVAMILDGGPCRVGLESTILFLGTESTPARVLRSGGISAECLADALGETVLGPIQNADSAVASDAPSRVAAPGQFAKHYSPRTPLILLNESPMERGDQRDSSDRRVLRIIFGAINGVVPKGVVDVWSFSPDGNLETAAAGLYALLREADAGDYDLIEVVSCEESGLGIAIMDRLRRASRKE
ncbi:L-threonylcarbamoyladenylate synthase [Aporhodopirellula aestuarii]|uniref:Threonylcarbamoyl-AMP synthase n=1 Tax=Aporhodopirellula aestuarii TaxID=2950107 RepID=A0ABT0UBW4_9BACT|nr:L-threonylcarbamoyladenylate synthase [Aporhodopirellula aestuarii]MCM2374400.1 L-threonylcarbamoyladenylate synthase [Aporhodopirellula aestuarii]